MLGHKIWDHDAPLKGEVAPPKNILKYSEVHIAYAFNKSLTRATCVKMNMHKQQLNYMCITLWWLLSKLQY